MRVGPHGRPKPLGDPYRRHVVFWWQRREVGECLHHDAPLPQSLAALVGLFGIVACDVMQAMFDDLLLEIRFLLCPGSERGAEAVCTVT
jgi:hypothetical protein